ncbi:MAG: LysM domain-containing protein, partial [Planctomycetota bacterium]
MEAALLIRSRILVVALILFVAGSALAWNRTYRRATSPAPDRPATDRTAVIEHGGRIVADAPVRPAPVPVRSTPVRPKPRPGPRPDPVPAARTVEVQNGDNLHRVAERSLGDSSRWREIADLNDLSEPYVIQPGQALDIP